MIVNYDFDIDKTKDGYNILKIYKDNKKIYLGSKYNMNEYLENIIKRDSEINNESILIIFGIGTGQYISRIIKKFPNIKVIIFEPNTKLIQYIKRNPEEYVFLMNKNIYLLSSDNPEEVYQGLRYVIQDFDLSRVLYRPLKNYNKIYEEQIFKFTTVVKTFLNDMIILRNTGMLFYKRWFHTLISNFKYMINGYPVESVKDMYKDIPAIIVSAGPSLNKNIDELKKIHNNIMILSGGRTLRSLDEKNIKPNLVGVVDPGDISYKLVEGYIEKLEVPLLFYEGTNEKVVEKHKDKKIFFTQNFTIKKIFDIDVENLGVGGSIAHTLTAVAAFMGCNPIIFIGQDLAYTGEKYHADIAINQYSEIQENKVKINEKGLYVEDVNGGKVRTSEVLDNFRRDLEKIIKKNKNITFINATEGGAKIEGTIQMTLKEVIEKYKMDKPIDGFKDSLKLNRKKIKENALECLEKIINSDKIILKQCEIALKTIKDLEKYILMKQNNKVTKCLKKMDEIDKVIKSNYEDLDILRSIIYPTVYIILSSNKPKSDKEIIERNRYLYESILNISKEVLEPIKKVKLDIEKMEI